MSCLESDIKTNHSIYAELDFLRSYHVAASLCTAGFKVKDAEEIVGELLPTEVQQCHDRMKKVMIEQEQLNRMFDNDSLICQVSTGIDYIEVEVHELLVMTPLFLLDFMARNSVQN
uniref:Uncharacterized protein n=1 Tax=Ditylenchus dipsaci TaxID=166011 RepID=A0A915DT39_9BILA